MRRATIQRAVALGALSGMRSTAGLTALSMRVRKKRSRHLGARLISSSLTRKLLPVVLGGEVLADKLPFMPNRTDPLPLAGRALIGALAGGILASEERGSVLLGGAIGAATAVAVSYLAYYARKYAHDRFALPDGVLATVEDGLVLGLGAGLRRP